MSTSSPLKRKRSCQGESLNPPQTTSRLARAAKVHVSYVDSGSESPLTGLESDFDRETGSLNELESGPTQPPKKKPRRKAKEPILADESLGKRRKRKAKEPIIYDIPSVEMKETTFKGRLGYACLNTILRMEKPDPIFCSRTCRIDTIQKKGIEFVKSLALQNVLDLAKMIQWNEDNKIRFMRMSSELFPFASHAKYGYDLEYAAKELKVVGDLANRLGHRLTAHPGQYTQLASPKENVVDASVRELAYHCRVMDLMGLGPDSVMVIHMGGVYGDKNTTLARFKINYEAKLSLRIKARLVLENDEICYNVDDLMPVCEGLNIPIVIDYHHDWINPSTRPLTELIPLINETWAGKGIQPKQHLSSPRPGAVTVMEKRAHADRCSVLPEGLPDNMDLMIEAKDKEQAVFHLYRIYNLESVVQENLRPEKPASLETNGRKGKSPRKRTQDAPDEDPVVELEETDSSTKGKGKAPARKRKAWGSVEKAADYEVVGSEGPPATASRKKTTTGTSQKKAKS